MENLKPAATKLRHAAISSLVAGSMPAATRSKHGFGAFVATSCDQLSITVSSSILVSMAMHLPTRKPSPEIPDT